MAVIPFIIVLPLIVELSEEYIGFSTFTNRLLLIVELPKVTPIPLIEPVMLFL